MRQQSTFDPSVPRFSLPQRSNSFQSSTHLKKAYPWRGKNPWGESDGNEEVSGDREPAPTLWGECRSTKVLATQSASRPPVLTRPVEAVHTPPPADRRPHPAVTAPLPAAAQAQPSIYTRFMAVSPKLKLVLVGVLVFTVLAGTFATADGSKQINQLFNVLHGSASAADAVSMADWPITQHVQPIIQADDNAGYDSQAQHDTWWDSVCSAASFTEVARAWGNTDVTIGKVLDRLLAHDPPYITVSGGLMSQDGWAWMAQAYGLKAQVGWHAYTFDSLVQQVTTSGMPMVIGMEGGDTSDPWGHFVVVTGGDSNQVTIADSSLWKMTSLPRSFFTEPTYGIINDPIWWSGETVLLTPA